MATILAIGGAHIDRKGWLDAPHIAGASNPGRWESEAGGGVFNAARTLARLGHAVTLVAPRGGDSEGAIVTQAAEQAGIEDCPITFLDRRTPSYSAILEPDGNLVTALADMALYDRLIARRLVTGRLKQKTERVDLVLVDANLRMDALAAVAAMAEEFGKPLVAIAISPAKVVRLTPVLSALTLVAMNRAEAAALTGSTTSNADGPMAQSLKALHLQAAVITAGAGPVTTYERDETACLHPPPLETLADVTGAGDALAAGMIDGLLAGLPLRDRLIRGIAAARLTAAVRGPVNPALVRESLEAETRRVAEMTILTERP